MWPFLEVGRGKGEEGDGINFFKFIKFKVFQESVTVKSA